uniref:Uncharacterized protein n=1 Tax=Anguilla anguilla TaxID=7936 RepID=A0A0E9R2A0_ANGAN
MTKLWIRVSVRGRVMCRRGSLPLPYENPDGKQPEEKTQRRPLRLGPIGERTNNSCLFLIPPLLLFKR